MERFIESNGEGANGCSCGGVKRKVIGVRPKPLEPVRLCLRSCLAIDSIANLENLVCMP